jgi:hypothetical protein
MSLNNSGQIVTDGLVFYYDQANTKKSWKGAPVTNAHWNGGSPFAPWTAGGVNTDITSTADGVPVPESKTWRFEKTGTTSQWNGWEGTYGGVWTGSAGDIWTTSYWYKTTQPSGLNGFQVGSFYTPDWVRAYASTILENQSSIIPDGKWRYNWTVTRIDEAYTNAIVVDGPAWGYSTTPGVLYINGLQWNKNSYAAPWAGGTRSNTQALLDMTGNNIITASSLTYSSNNSFSFNGINNYLQVPHSSALAPTRAITLEAFCTTDWQTTNNVRILSKTEVGGWQLSLNDSAGNVGLTIHVGGTYRYSVVPKTTISAGYHHIVGTCDGRYAILYIDGIVVNTLDIGSYLPLTYSVNNDLIIGAEAGTGGPVGANFINATIPICKIYNRALSAQEVRQNFNATRRRYGL